MRPADLHDGSIDRAVIRREKLAIVHRVRLGSGGEGLDRIAGSRGDVLRHEPFGGISQRHHATEGPREGDESEDKPREVVPVIPPLFVRDEPFLPAATRLDGGVDADVEAGNDHDATDAGEPDDGAAPEVGVLPESGEVDPMRDGPEPSPDALFEGGALEHFAGA